MRTKPEILAPAGSVQGLKAAVAAGCDAVYIGGKRFGARAFAENPDDDEMLEAIAYCHLHHVKIYLTVNTLLKDRELEESLFDYLKPYYEAGLDAVIVQDVGVLRFIKEHFPALSVHASTQMTLTQGSAVKLLQKYSVDRIVPARELSLEELRRMRSQCDVELEVFVHGALCYCYSGQCLFSSMLGGRSGNRGRCAQPCRMPYFIDGRRNQSGDYLLSPKELCNLSYLPELIEAGVNSFKIEGRMKRPEYAAFVTAMFRKYVDLYFSLGRQGYLQWQQEHVQEWNEDLRCLAELYNRNGFTQGYLEGKAGLSEAQMPVEKGLMLAQRRPKHGGVCVGKVLSVGEHQVSYQTTERLSPQDVVEFRDRYQRTCYEYTLGNEVAKGKKVTARYQKGSKIAVGDLVYRTKDAPLLDEIRNRFLEKKEQLPVQGKFSAKKNQPMTMTVERDGFSVICTGDLCQRAQKQQATKETVERALRQTGEGNFYFGNLEISLEENLFLPVGALKKLRRQALEELEQTIKVSHFRYDTVTAKEREKIPVTAEEVAPSDSHKRKLTASVMNAMQLSAVLPREDVSGIYLRTEQMSGRDIKEAYQQIKGVGKEAYLVLPVIFRAGVQKQFEQDLRATDSFLRLLWDGFLVKNMESVVFLKNIVEVPTEKIRLDDNMYIMNREAYRFWLEAGISKVTLPPEATEREMEQFDFLAHSEMQVYGRIPLMVSAQCLLANAKGCRKKASDGQSQVVLFEDTKGRKFEAVNCCKYCYNIIYQKEPLDLRQQLQEKEAFAEVSLRYSFSTESPEEISQILQGGCIEKTQKGHFEQGID